MKQFSKLLFTLVTCLLFDVSANSQVTKTLNGTVRYESGTSETKFSTPNGNVVMKLPQSLSGTTITGTVSAEPAGKTEKEKNKNLEQLLKFTVNLDGQKIPVSVTPANFDWLTNPGRESRTPMELLNSSGTKLAEVSLPSVLSSPATFSSGNAPRLTTPSNVLVKGDALNVYTNQQFSPGEKFILTDSKGLQFTMNPIARSSQQAVMNVPEGAAPGNYSVSRQVDNHLTIKAGVDSPLPDDNPNWYHFNLIDINLSSPNTNLRSRQTSSVTLAIHTRNQAEMDNNESLVFRVDMKNLTPGVVDMAGGNMQAISFPLSENRQDPSAWQLSRTITGVKPGSFSVSATLHDDYSSSNDPFRPQVNVLKTPEDFNAWVTALKKDLETFAGIQTNDGPGQVIKTNTQRAIDNIPVCSDPGQLDECKAVIYSLIHPLQVPKGAAISWLSSYEALKAVMNDLAGNSMLTDFDVLRNGIEFINRIAQYDKETALQSECGHVQEFIDKVQTTGETKENLQELKDKIKELTVRADRRIQGDDHISLKTGMKDLKLASYQLPSLASPGRVHPYNDLIGFLDPVKKTLFVLPEYSSQVLSMINARLLANGQYHINSMTANRKPIAYEITVAGAGQSLLFDEAEKKDDDKKKDELKSDPAKELENKAPTIYLEYTDNTGTKYFFYRNAECKKITDPKKDDECKAVGWYVYNPKTDKFEYVLSGVYEKTEHLGISVCQKGNGYCYNMSQVTSIIHKYNDKNCKGLIEIGTVTGNKCQ